MTSDKTIDVSKVEMSSFSKEFISLAIPEWKNQYVDYPTIRRAIRLAEETSSNPEKKKNIVHKVMYEIMPAEIDKINAFFKRTEEKYTKRHGELRDQYEKWEELIASTRRKQVLKAKLIRAYQEHNKAVTFLKNYKELNHTALLRLFHKLELAGAGSIEAHQKKFVEEQYFWVSGLCEFMLRDIEKMFTQYFFTTHKTAIDKLNTFRDETARVQYVWLSGLFCGISLLATTIAMYIYFADYLNMTIDYGSTSITMFKVSLFPIVLLALQSVNLFIWNANYINYVFIFELDPTKRISKYQFLEMACFTWLVWHLHFIIYMILATQKNLYAWIVPIVMYFVYAAWLVMPFNIMYRGARYWFIDVVFRNLFAPLVPVKFKDFYIGDQLTSLGDFLNGIQFVVCIWPAFVDPNTSQGCKNYVSLGLPILGIWPNIARFLQCLRRYYDDPTKFHPHLVNGGKYLSTVVAILFGFLDARIVANGKPYAEWNWARTCWVIANVISTFWKLGYDILMDWGLCSFVFGKKDAKYPFLKKQLIFKPYWYYLAVFVNTVLRFLWVIILIINVYLLDTMRKLGVNLYVDIVLGCLELIRRFVWNIFRLENEQLSNIDQYRVTIDVPLPFERHTILIEKETPLEHFEDLVFRLVPCLRRDDDPLLDYETSIEEFIGRTTKKLLGNKDKNMTTASFRVDKPFERVELDEDDLAITREMHRKVTELTFDSIGDTGNSKRNSGSPTFVSDAIAEKHLSQPEEIKKDK